MVEITVYYREGALGVHVCFHILAFGYHPAFIWAGHWVTLAHWPVVGNYVFIPRTISLTVVTSERTFGTGLILVDAHIATLEAFVTVSTRNRCKLTANELLACFWVQIQVFIQFSQFSCPLTSTLVMYAPHTKGA